MDCLLNDIWQTLKTAELDHPYNAAHCGQTALTQLYGVEVPMGTGRWAAALDQIYLILLYMHKTGLNKAPLTYSLHYETRSESATFLERLGDEGLDDYASNIDSSTCTELRPQRDIWRRSE